MSNEKTSTLGEIINDREELKMYFELDVEYYPNSANAYDSMVDYYEAQNDMANAIKFAQKAFETSIDKYYKNRLQPFKNRR